MAKRPGGSRASCSRLSATSCCRSLSRCWRAVVSRACAPRVGWAARSMGWGVTACHVCHKLHGMAGGAEQVCFYPFISAPCRGCSSRRPWPPLPQVARGVESHAPPPTPQPPPPLPRAPCRRESPPLARPCRTASRRPARFQADRSRARPTWLGFGFGGQGWPRVGAAVSLQLETLRPGFRFRRRAGAPLRRFPARGVVGVEGDDGGGDRSQVVGSSTEPELLRLLVTRVPQQRSLVQRGV